MLGTLRDNFMANVSRWSDRTAIIYGDHAHTYGELNAQVNRLVHFLIGLGVRKGDGVGLLLHNCAEFAVGFLACQKLGAVSSCLNYRLSAGPVGYVVEQERLKALIFNAEFSGKVAEIMKDAGFCRFIGVGGPVPDGAVSFDECAGFPATEPPAVDIREATCATSSILRGRPAGRRAPHSPTRRRSSPPSNTAWRWGWIAGHVGMSLAPVVIGAATNFFVAYLFIGAAQVMIGEYEAQKALRLIARHKVTESFAVPTQMYQMAEAKRQIGDIDVSSLRLYPQRRLPVAQDAAAPGARCLECEVLNTYGTTESCTAITNCHTGLEPEESGRASASPAISRKCGSSRSAKACRHEPDEVIASPGEGQLINRGPQCVSEYYCTPLEKLRACGGWQYARDIVRIDAKATSIRSIEWTT